MFFFKKEKKQIHSKPIRKEILSKLDKKTVLISSERLNLCLYTIDDHEEWAHLRAVSRDNLQPWEPTWTDDVLSKSAFMKRVAFYETQINKGRGVYFLIKRKDDNKIVGGVSLRYIVGGNEQSCVIGYWCAVPYLRNGYVYEAVSATIDFVFKELKLNRIQASCMKNNQPSLNLLKKLGFEYEGTAKEYLKICGKWTDHEIFALVKSKYNQ